MDIEKEYKNLREMVRAYLPDTFTINNNLIEECPYDAPSFMPINFNPYKQNGCYYPTFYEYTPRVYTGKAPTYRMSKGEETTICMWNAMLQYEEYDLLADLLILGFLHDHHSIAGNFYTLDDMEELMERARTVLEENRYGKHNPRCKKYLSIYDGETFSKYRKEAWNDELEIKDTAEFARIMMEIIADEYGSKYFIIRCPSDLSNEWASKIQSEATNRFFEQVLSSADETGGKEG